jgi:hypothetical protein
MCGPSKGITVLAADPVLNETPSRGVGFGMISRGIGYVGGHGTATIHGD